MTLPALRVLDLSKLYDTVSAVDGLTLQVSQGEVLAIIGPSGCGKTTLLRLLAGFERPTGGEVHIDGRLVAGPEQYLPPERRGVGMVFQDYALFPHLTVGENVGFGLGDQPASTRLQEVRSLLRLVGLEERLDDYPHELSGGERQRVALARALAPKPIILLLDEPFSNLDADRRVQMREEVKAILTSIHATAIFVTHDQEEALYMGDRLAVLRAGRLEQVGSPEDIFLRPGSRFVAEFMGQTDFLPGRVTAEGVMTEIGLLRQPMELPIGQAVEVAFRHDDVSFLPDGKGDALVLARQFKGAYNLYRLRLASGRLIHASQPHTHTFHPGTRAHVQATPGHPLACFPNGNSAP